MTNLSTKVKIIVNIVAVCFLILEAAFLWTFRDLNLESMLMGINMAGAAGLLLRKEWGRKLFLVSAAMSIGYHLVMPVFTHETDVVSLALMTAWLLGIIVYILPPARRLYQFGFHVPLWSILIVDDDKTLLKLMRKNFFREGIPVVTAATGEAGLQMALRHKFDAIILDVVLPGLKGFEICARIKEDSRMRDVPIIFLTVKDSPHDVHAEREAGAVLHMTKPVDFQALFRQIKKILGDSTVP